MAISSGDFITITRRKCSDKIQPNIKVGGIYAVLETDTLKDGTKVLVLVRDGRKKTTTRCNAKRFDWKLCKQEHVAKRLADLKTECFDRRVTESCTDEENAAVSYRPVMLLMIMWRYGDLVLDYCSKNKLTQFKKKSRDLRKVREDAMSYLSDSLSPTEVENVRRNVEEFVAENKFDFSALQYNVKNSLIIRCFDIEHPDLYTNAMIGILICRELYNYELKAMEILSDKCIYRGTAYHLPYRKEFFLCMTDFLEDISYDLQSSQIVRCMEIFKRNFNNIVFTREK